MASERSFQRQQKYTKEKVRKEQRSGVRCELLGFSV